MKYIITESQMNRIDKMVSDYLEQYDWVTWDSSYNDMTRLFIKGEEHFPENTKFEAYNEQDEDDDGDFEYRVLLVDIELWSTIRSLFGIPENQLDFTFLKWYNSKTGEMCTRVDTMD
jgi:hypothetical protein